ncbi:MAG TPA: DUF6285 domain-containing protein [Acidimicrobiales bacterium]|nr:DUF6285 domain-containing protein [Acidimicrobiales bacterium]
MTPDPERPGALSPAGPHDAPTAAELVEAVREFLEADVMDATDGRVQFHTRVAINVLGVVRRELELGQAQAARHAAGLARLGLPDDAALAAAIGTGVLDDRLDEVAAFVRQTVEDKLTVANPRYFGGPAERS